MEVAQVKCKEREELLPGLHEKKRNSPADEKNISVSKVFKSGGMDKPSQRSLKKMKEGADIVHADSQRILRETRGTTFAPERVMQKPVSSLIEKIRQRKLQLTSRIAELSSSSVDGSSRISTVDDVGAACTEKASNETLEKSDVQDEELEFVAMECTKRPEIDQTIGELSATKMDQHEDFVCNSSPIALRPPMVDTQDLYSDSQSSLWKEEIPAARTENPVSAEAFKMNLHLDSETQETQDDDLSRWLEKGTDKKYEGPVVLSPPKLSSSVSNVRDLLDDEAEDEDDDPSEDEDNDDEDSKVELRELLTQDATENETDVNCRSELHSKWLEQQDLAMEDSILHRMETGWKRKGKNIPEFLGTEQGISFCESASRSVIGDDSVEGPSSSNARCNTNAVDQIKERPFPKTATGSSKRPSKGQGEGCYMKQNDLQESSDDEEANEKLRLQLILEESEEQEGFLSVAEDESSRDIFTLINKVNVTTVKPRNTGHSEARTNGNAPHHLAAFEHQSSFLRRKVTTALVTTRHGSGTSRSYIFGRDDSNSRDSARSEDKKPPPVKPPAGSSNEQTLGSATRRVQKCEPRPEKGTLLKESNVSGPSLFQILKQQAAELASSSAPLSLDGRGSRADDLASFLAVRPTKQRRKSRGT